MLQHLRASGLSPTAMVALDDIYSDGAAPLLELSSPMAAPLLGPLCEEMAFVGPKRLTIRSLASPERWEKLLEEVFASDPSCCGIRLRHRSSRQGDRVIAQPAATRRQLDACAREAARDASQIGTRAPRCVRVQASGLAGGDGALIVQGILAHLAAQGLPFAPAAAGSQMQPGQWMALQDLQENVDGRLCLTVADEIQAQQELSLVHEKAFAVGGDVITITAVEDGAQREAAKNGRRGGRRGAPPPGAWA